jgi:hypothetical protein
MIEENFEDKESIGPSMLSLQLGALVSPTANRVLHVFGE